MYKLTCACILFFGLANAREPYHVAVTVSTTTANVSAPNLVDLKNDLTSVALVELIPIYTPTSAVSFGLNLRGLLANLSFASNSTDLIVNIPQAGISTTISGTTRDESIAVFKEYIRDFGNGRRLLQAYAKYSPIDPVAGNPNSLMAQMAQADYALGILSPLSVCDSCLSTPL